MSDLDRILDDHRVVICAGSGGVGKTTTAASLAVRAALRGKRTVVMTIDPAKRLANSLGIVELGGRPVPVNHPALEGCSLSAMMLDQKGAWDQLVERHAPSPEARDRILKNRFYENLSRTFAGSQEYMAIEQLCELYESDQFDVIVVDTPPTRHALDFLEAPQRLADFLDRNVIKWFVKPYFSAGWSTMRLLNRTASLLFRRLEEATGITALVEVSEFFTSMSTLFDGFEERVHRVYEVLRSPDTAFVLVATPEEQVLQEAKFFRAKVDEMEMSLRAVVFNRVHRNRPSRTRDEDGCPDLQRRLAEAVDGSAAGERLERNYRRYERLGRGDVRRLGAFRAALGADVAVVEVPNFAGDVHSVEGLQSMHRFLFAADGE